MSARLGLMLAATAAIAGAVLIWLSGGFIMASGLAGIAAGGAGAIAFNLMIPSALVRLSALSRVAATYASRLVLHDVMLERIHQSRVALLSSWISQPWKSLTQQGWQLDRLLNTLDQSGLRLMSVDAANWAGLALLGTALLASIVQPLLLISFGWVALMLVPIRLVAIGIRDIQGNLLAAQERVTQQQVNLLAGSREILAYQTIDPALAQIDDTELTTLQALLTRRLLGLGVLVDIVIAVAIMIGLLSLDDWVWRCACALGLLALHEPLEKWAQGLTQAPAVTIEPAAPATDQLSTTVKAHNVWVGVDVALNSRAIDLDLGQTPRVWLTGPSGVGKSLFLNALVGLRPALSGHIERPQKLGYLPQTPHIFTQTVRENLSLYNTAATDAELHAAIAAMGLQNRLQQLDQELNPDQLSGGEIRRIGIIRLMLSQIDTWILDEPLAGLDDASKQCVLKQISAARSWVIVSHDDTVRHLEGLVEVEFPFQANQPL